MHDMFPGNKLKGNINTYLEEANHEGLKKQIYLNSYYIQVFYWGLCNSTVI